MLGEKTIGLSFDRPAKAYQKLLCNSQEPHYYKSGEAKPKIERLFESVNQSCITSLRWFAKKSFLTFYAKKLVC